MNNVNIHRVVAIRVSEIRENGAGGFDQDIDITTRDGGDLRVTLYAKQRATLLPFRLLSIAASVVDLPQPEQAVIEYLQRTA